MKRLLTKEMVAIIAIAMIAVLCTGSAQAQTVIVFDANSSSFMEGAQTLTWSHTIAGGSSRLLVVGLATKNRKAGGAVVRHVAYNDVNMVEVTGSYIYVNRGQTNLYYMLDANLPSAGTYPVVVTYEGNVDCSVGGAVSLENVKQQPAEVVDTNSGQSMHPISTDITTLTDGAWVLDVVSLQKVDGSFDPNTAGMVERWDEISGTSQQSTTGAGSTKPVASAGLTTMSWSYSTYLNNWTHSLAAFAPAAVAPPTYTVTATAPSLKMPAKTSCSQQRLTAATRWIRGIWTATACR